MLDSLPEPLGQRAAVIFRLAGAAGHPPVGKERAGKEQEERGAEVKPGVGARVGRRWLGFGGRHAGGQIGRAHV